MIIRLNNLLLLAFFGALCALLFPNETAAQCSPNAPKYHNFWPRAHPFGSLQLKGVDFNSQTPTSNVTANDVDNSGSELIESGYYLCNPETGKPMLASLSYGNYQASVNYFDEQGILKPMPNGEYACGSTSIILPNPTNPNKYYVFCQAFPLRYSEIDMTLNGGKGDVFLKNVYLAEQPFIGIPGGYPQNATRHANGKDYWLIQHVGNTWFSYLIDSNGVNNPPIITVNTFEQTGGGGTLFKISPDGRTIASQEGDTNFRIYKFNNATGKITKTFIEEYPGSGIPWLGVPLLEFSPDGRLLYVVRNYADNQNNYGSFLFQFDLSSNDPFIVSESKVVLHHSSTFFLTGQTDADDIYSENHNYMQLAPDCKIYGYRPVTSQFTIHNPNVYGPGCNLELNTTSLGLNKGGALPLLVSSHYFPYSIHITPSSGILTCGAASIPLSVATTGLDGDLAYQWYRNDLPIDGATGATLAVTTQGVYSVKVTQNADGFMLTSHTVYIGSEGGGGGAPSANFTPPAAICAGQSAVFSAPATPGVGYHWTFAGGAPASASGAGPHTVTFATAGAYAITLTATKAGCTAGVNHTYTVTNGAGALTAASNSPLCAGGTLLLTGSAPDFAMLVWNGPNGFTATSSTPNLLNVSAQASGVYTLTATLFGCSASAAVEVQVKPEPTATLTSSGLTICSGEQTTLPVKVTGVGPWTVKYVANGVAQPPITLGSADSPSPSVFWITVTPTQTTTYLLTAVADAACEGGANGATTITVNAGLTLNLVSIQPYGACGQTGSVQLGGDALNYTLNGVTNTTGTFTGLTPGDYTAIGTSNGDCNATLPITITTAPSLPTLQAVTTFTETSAVVSWESYPNAQSYILAYRQTSSGTFTILPGITQTTKTLTGLATGADYEVKVRAVCTGGAQTGYSASQYFTTASTCTTPQGLNVTVLGPTTIKMNWGLVSGANCYLITFGPISNNPNTWTKLLASHPSQTATLNTFSPGVTYGFRIRTNCTLCSATSGVRSPFSSIITATTPSGRASAATDAALTPELSAQVYPNPTHGAFTVNYQSSGETTLRLYDSTGRLVQVESLPEGISELALDLTQKARGVYLLELSQTESARRQTIKVVVQ